MQTKLAESAKPKWTPSQFKGVSKRYGGLAEYDIPYNVSAIAKEIQRGWRKEDLTPEEFEEKYGPFDTSLGLPEATRITHTRRTSRGYEMKYLEPEALDITKPWGVTGKDVEAWKKQDKLFTAHLAQSFMAGGIWQKAELSPKQFREKYGVSFELPKESLITGWRRGPKGYEIKYMPKKEWEALPTYAKEGREPTFWEIPLYKHFQSALEGYYAQMEEREKQIHGPAYVAWEKETFLGRRRTSDIELSFIPVYMVKAAESFVGSVEALAGHPSHRTYIPTVSSATVSTVVSFFPETKLGPFTIGKGGWGTTGEYLEAEWESIKEHPEAAIVGELAFDVLLAYVTGVGLKKTWHAAKWVGGKAGPVVKKAAVWTGEKTWQYAKPVVKTTLGPERYYYYSTGISRAIWGQRIATIKAYGEFIGHSTRLVGRNLETIPRSMFPESYSLLKSVYGANITRLHKVLGSTVSHYAGYIPKPSLPTLNLSKAITRTQPYMLARDVYIPNIGQLRKFIAINFAPTKGLASSIPEIGFPAIPHISKPQVYMLLKNVYAPNVASYLKAQLPNIPRLNVSIKQIGIFTLGKERYYYYRYLSMPLTKAKYTHIMTAMKGMLPDASMLKPEWLKYRPEWFFETKAFTKTLAGKTRWKLHIPTPKAPYKPMAPFTSLITQQTATKTLSTLITREIVKPKSSFAKILSPSTLVPTAAVTMLKSPVKTKREKKSELPELVEWKGLEYPSKFAMEKDFSSRILQRYPTEQQITPVLKLTKKQRETLKLAGFARFAMGMAQRPIQIQKQKQSQKQKQKQRQIQKLVQLQMLRQEQISEQDQRQEPFLRTMRIQAERVVQQQTQTQIQQQRQLQKQQQIQELVHGRPTLPRLELGGLQKRRRRGPRFGAWFYRTHAIARPQDVIGLIGRGQATRSPVSQFNKRMYGGKRKRRNNLEDLARKLKAVI